MSGEPGSEWFAGTLLEPQYPSSQQQQGVHRLNSSLGTCILQKTTKLQLSQMGQRRVHRVLVQIQSNPPTQLWGPFSHTQNVLPMRNSHLDLPHTHLKGSPDLVKLLWRSPVQKLFLQTRTFCKVTPSSPPPPSEQFSEMLPTSFSGKAKK